MGRYTIEVLGNGLVRVRVRNRDWAYGVYDTQGNYRSGELRLLRWEVQEVLARYEAYCKQGW